MNAIIVGALVLLAYSFSQQGNSLLKTVTVTPLRMRGLKPGFFSQSFDLVFSIQNRGNASFTLQAIDGIVKANGLEIGQYLSTGNEIKVNPRTTVEFTVKVNLTNFQLIETIYKTITTGKSPRIDLDGGLQTTFGRFPYTYNLFLKQDLTFSKKA